MSISSLRNEIQRLTKEIVNLQKKRASECQSVATHRKRAAQIQASITKTTSPSSYASKQKDAAYQNDKAVACEQKIANIDKDIANKESARANAQARLTTEQEREEKKALEAEKKRQREIDNWKIKLAKELEDQKRLMQSSSISALTQLTQDTERNLEEQKYSYDVFISHASEDKEEFVHPLAEKLQEIGFKVWYDSFSLIVGSSLRKSIDQGLQSSRYGIVVFSRSFFAKGWTNYELDGLVQRQIRDQNTILPILHNVSIDQVRQHSLSLADIIALNTGVLTLEQIVDQLAIRLRM